MASVKLQVGKAYTNAAGETVIIDQCHLLTALSNGDSVMIYAGKVATLSAGTINYYYTEDGNGVSGFIRDFGYSDPPSSLQELPATTDSVWVTQATAVGALKTAGYNVVTLDTPVIRALLPTDSNVMYDLFIYPQGVLNLLLDEIVKAFPKPA